MDEQIIPEGERNPTLYAEACRLFREGLPEDEVREKVLTLNTQKCAPPSDEGKIIEMVQRVSKSHTPAAKPKRTSLRWFALDATEVISSMDYKALTDTQLGWRTLLLAYAWLNEAKLPNDLVHLAKMASLAR